MPVLNSAFSQFLQATRPRTYPIAIASLAVSQSLAYRSLGGFEMTNWVLAFFDDLYGFVLTNFIQSCQ